MKARHDVLAQLFLREVDECQSHDGFLSLMKELRCHCEVDMRFLSVWIVRDDWILPFEKYVMPTGLVLSRSVFGESNKRSSMHYDATCTIFEREGCKWP